MAKTRSPRESTRVRPGDMKIDLHGLDVRMTTYVDRDKVTLEKRALINGRIAYLQHLAATISEDDWPLDYPAFLAAPLSEEKPRG